MALRALILAALLAGCASHAEREERADRALRMAEWARGGGTIEVYAQIFVRDAQ